MGAISVSLLLSCAAYACGGESSSNDGSGATSGSGGGGGSTGGTAGSTGGGTGGVGGGSGGTGGGAGGNAGAAGSGAAGGGGTAGAPAMTCEELDSAYVQAVQDAKSCVYGTQPDPCTTLGKSDLECQCPVYINPANTAAVTELAKLEAQWNAQKCVSVPCPCAAPVPATCYAGPGGPSDGKCG